MAEWTVRLIGESVDLQSLSELFDSQDLSVSKEDDNYYLESSAFTPLSDAESVRNQASELVQRINGAASIHLGSFEAVWLDDVVRVDDDGSRHHHMTLTSKVRVISSASITTPKGTVGTSRPTTGIDTWLSVAEQNQRVARALRIFGNREHNWDNLYKVYEAVEDDVGRKKIVDEGWASDKKISRFTSTANNVRAVGDEARHGHEKFDPPKKPIPLSEARHLVKGILQGWLRSKTL